MNKRPILVSSAALRNSQGQFLLGLRSKERLWEFPGGKVEDESAEQGAIREVREETGVDLVGPSEVFGYADLWPAFGSRGIQSYFCVGFMWSWYDFRNKPRVVESCHLKWRWFDLDEFPSHGMMTAGTNILLPQLRRHMEKRK